MDQDTLVTIWTCKPSLLQCAICSSDLGRFNSFLRRANLIPWKREGCCTSGKKLVCVACTREVVGEHTPPWVLFALVLIFCRVVPCCQADVWTLLTSYLQCSQATSIPMLGGSGKQWGFLTWANSSLSFQRKMSSQKEMYFF